MGMKVTAIRYANTSVYYFQFTIFALITDLEMLPKLKMQFQLLSSCYQQIIYKIKLPGQPILGEGKAENQNHAIIFTRGDALQAIDMNQVRFELAVVHCWTSVLIDFAVSQDFYLEESLKMRNFLQEFYVHNGIATPSILGMREHIFSGR
jgi:hypothetical protein